MALRFTDTEKWKDEWWQSLSNDYRIVWQYLLDHCDHAGTFKREFRLLNFECGTNITEQQFDKVFGHRIVKSKVYDRWLILNFCRSQYPKGLDSNKPVIVSVRELLDKYGFLSIVIESFTNHYEMIKDKDKDTGEGKGEEKGSVRERGLAVTKKELVPRTPDTIRAYFAEHGQPGEADKFIDYYQSNGWKVGHNSMKDWQATARNWMRRAQPDQKDRRIVRNTTVADIQDTAKRLAKLMGETNEHDNDSSS